MNKRQQHHARQMRIKQARARIAASSQTLAILEAAPYPNNRAKLRAMRKFWQQMKEDFETIRTRGYNSEPENIAGTAFSAS